MHLAAAPDPPDGPAAAEAAAAAGPADSRAEEAARAAAPAGWLNALRRLPKVYGLTAREWERIVKRNASATQPPPSGRGESLANGVVIAVVSLASRIFMRGLNGMHLYHLGALTDAVEARPPGVGLLTVSNHRSVADDPIMLAAMLPPRIVLRPSRMRWGMCSVDICFQNAAMARFMTLGKALPVMRGAGVGHPYVTAAAEKLVLGDWLHMYPEGRVVQHGMGYMKRGVGKVLAIAYERAAERAAGGAAVTAVEPPATAAPVEIDADVNVDATAAAPGAGPPASAGLPIVLPMYHEGVEDIMPQDRETHELFSVIPRVGYRMFAIVGDPIDMRDIFDRLMPPCAHAGGTRGDAPECLALYEAVADRCALSVRLLRAELRLRVRADLGLFLGDPFECT
jgi:1-acyl-sn-glycerol-3-phosphate acyltransferase